ncbi:MAG: carbonic anhydrase, partial [Planctomycetes bacterium]|nr:carbonic anhydrase [Planctomycetota bacterium]
MSLRVSLVLCAVALVGCSSAPTVPTPFVVDAAFSPSTLRTDGIERLLAGNARFVSGHAHGEGRDAARRTEVANGQHPYAIVITCSDSRVSPEIVFDAGIGDLFVIRTAGHVIDDHALGSIEYAAEHLHTKTVLVLGHERCGAVGAAMQGGELPGHIGSLVTAIAPNIKNANRGN